MVFALSIEAIKAWVPYPPYWLIIVHSILAILISTLANMTGQHRALLINVMARRSKRDRQGDKKPPTSPHQPFRSSSFSASPLLPPSENQPLLSQRQTSFSKPPPPASPVGGVGPPRQSSSTIVADDGGKLRDAQTLTEREEWMNTILEPNDSVGKLSVVKSLVMIIVLFYHFPMHGGWARFTLLSLANLSSGQYSYLVSYFSKLLFPTVDCRLSDQKGLALATAASSLVASSGGAGGGGKGSAATAVSAYDSWDLLEALGKVLDVEDVLTVFIQATAFILVGIAVVPPVITFVLPGTLLFFWIFLPPCLLLTVLRKKFYAQPFTLGLLKSGNSRWLMVEALSLRIFFHLFVTLWIQMSAMQAAVYFTAESHSYIGAVELEASLRSSLFDQLRNHTHPVVTYMCLVSALLP